MLLKTKLTEKFQEKIKKMAPWAQNVKVKVDRTANGIYKSIIKVKATRKVFIAVKVNKSIEKALDRATHAIFKQLDRHKVKRIHNVKKLVQI